MTVRGAVYALLREFQLTTVFGNPGSTELPMFRDFPADFRYVLGLHESVVVAMADGYAQARDQAALVNLHSAVGVGHAMGSIFTAFRNQTPFVITAGQQARSILPYEPFLYSEQAAQLPKPYVKWSVSRRVPTTCLPPLRARTTSRCKRRADRPSYRYRWTTGIATARHLAHVSRALSWLATPPCCAMRRPRSHVPGAR